jgi:predicted helicase
MKRIKTGKDNTWITGGLRSDFDEFIPLGTKETKKSARGEHGAIFQLYSNGVLTARDAWAYSFSKQDLVEKMDRFIEQYNIELEAWKRRGRGKDPREFVLEKEPKIPWTRRLLKAISNHRILNVDKDSVRRSLYRPFTKQYVYFDKDLNEEIYSLPHIFPTHESEDENRLICTVTEAQMPFSAQLAACIPCYHYSGRQTQCFPFYTYDEDGSNRRENITDWAVEEFNKRYASVGGTKNQRQAERSRSLSKAKSRMTPFDSAQGDVDARGRITKWDIFHYIYAVLHHPMYREKYAANLRRELPRIPFVKDFWAFAEAGKKLATLHVEYEKQKEYKLEVVESKVGHLNYRVEKMKLSKDKKTLTYNDFFTLGGIPKEAFEYRLGNRSALEWIIDQYQVSTDKRSGITNDPNRTDDPEYIMRLVGQVITVSVETVKIVKALPEFKVETS